MSDTDAHEEIIDLMVPLRRYVGAHVGSRQDVDDVVQETLTRVLAAQSRLDHGVALAYSIVVARGVMADEVRRDIRRRTNAHRLIDLTRPALPEDSVLQVEERAALEDALQGVGPEQRDVLLAHVLEDAPVTAIAQDAGVSSGSVAAQLARTRARLRVDYVLALRGVQLPTDRCRPVLLALSAADVRRQRVLRAGNHLLTCATCSEISEPLLRRRSVLAAILPWLGLGPLLGFLRRVTRQAPGQTAAVGAGATLGAVALVVAVQSGGSPPVAAPPPTPAATTSATPAAVTGQIVAVTGSRILRPDAADLTAWAGDRVRGTEVPVVSVPADEGFWIGDARHGRIWVQLVGVKGESPDKIRSDDSVTFSATVVANGSDYARRNGVSAGEGAALLTRQGVHLRVTEDDLHVVTP